MTCQWCRNYRRRSGVSKCWTPGENGVLTLEDLKGRNPDNCGRFDPRRSCSTCEYRCPSDERSRLLDEKGGCPKWTLRKLSTWGGYRRHPSNS